MTFFTAYGLQDRAQLAIPAVSLQGHAPQEMGHLGILMLCLAVGSVVFKNRAGQAWWYTPSITAT